MSIEEIKSEIEKLYNLLEENEGCGKCTRKIRRDIAYWEAKFDE